MRSLFVKLVFALSLSTASARCVKKDTQPSSGSTKQGVQSGSDVLASNATTDGSESLGSGSVSGSYDSSSSTTSSPPSLSTGDSGSNSGSQQYGPNSTGDAGGAMGTPSPSTETSSNSTQDTSAGSDTYTNSSTKTTTSSVSGSCAAMKGIVFNGGMKPAMYDKITTATQWITFQLDIPGSGASSRTIKDHIPMMAFASHVPDAIKLVNGDNPPEWLLTFNEPDFSYEGTPKMNPQEAADAIKPLIAQPGKSTKFVAPATAAMDGNWQQAFYDACGCKDFFSAYNMHIYNADAKASTGVMQDFHKKFGADKPLWVTEIAPGQAGCSVSWDAAGEYMKYIYKYAMNSGFVEKIFWNSGNQLNNGDQNVCNSWLMSNDDSMNPSPLMQMYEDEDCT
ncbi:MAG: hypothetical protein Q9222_003775 [Ikaeria aurantiellina]